ncbi:MAG: carboxypeptidase regulatory-like domain-containing protein [Halothiobacillaceae bacterium]|nr:MAG: carboxypeptidase regulatory-like domain-containing protein [Halothiobacillaceae bacterium]
MRRSCLALLALLASAPLHAQSPDDPDYERIEKSPPTQEEIDGVILIPSIQNGISYIGGGVGVVERKALDQWARDYTLRIEMALKSGEYVGDKQVRILDAQGAVLIEARSDGPLFYTMLPTGRYVIEIRNGSVEPQRREVTISADQQRRAFFVWP